MRGGRASGVVRWGFRDHGRFLLAAYLIGAPALVLLVGAVAAFRPAWVEGAVGHWDDRWTRRLEHGEALVSDGRYAEAATYLEGLDRVFPAQFIKHKRDTQRERLLAALGQAQEGAGRRNAALATYERLAAFDPRNYRNHFLLASAFLRDKKSDEAVGRFEAVLAIHPSHQPSVEALVRLHFEDGAFADVVSVFERYLDAVRFCMLAMEADGVSEVVAVPVDGRARDVAFILPFEEPWSGSLRVSGMACPIELGDLSVSVPLGMGRAVMSERTMRLDASAWSARGMAAVGPGRYRPVEAGCLLEIDGDGTANRPARFGVRIRLFKSVGPASWAMVEKSYRNRLAFSRLDALRDRVAVIE